MKLPPAGALFIFASLCFSHGQSPGTPARSGQSADSGDQFAPPPHRPGLPGLGPSSSGSQEADPEGGAVKGDEYVNPYFGLTYRLPEGWREDFKGPEPSDGGGYVLSSFRPKGELNGTVLITAQDMFFSSARTAMDLFQGRARNLSAPAKIDKEPYGFEAGNHSFVRFDFSGMSLWHVILALDVRCHVLTFNLVSRDRSVLEKLIQSVSAISLTNGDFPVCVANYAVGPNLLHKVEPAQQGPRFIVMPVRLIINTQGKVKHVHVIHAFPGQAKLIQQALLQWVARPYALNGKPVEVETGLLFEFPSKHKGVGSNRG